MRRFEAVLLAPTPYIVGLPTDRWRRIVADLCPDAFDSGASPVPPSVSALVVDVDQDAVCMCGDSVLPPLPARVRRTLVEGLQAAGVTSLSLNAAEWRRERVRV